MEQRELAERAGMSVPTLKRMEGGEGLVRGNYENVAGIIYTQLRLPQYGLPALLQAGEHRVEPLKVASEIREPLLTRCHLPLRGSAPAAP